MLRPHHLLDDEKKSKKQLLKPMSTAPKPMYTTYRSHPTKRHNYNPIRPQIEEI